MTSLQFLIDSIKRAPVIIKDNNYAYFIHSITDGALPIYPEFLFKVSRTLYNAIRDDGNIPNTDLIIAPEAMALPVATLVSSFMEVPYVIARKRKYGLPGEIEISQQTGYSKNLMYVNSVKSGDNVIIIDDVVSTGGTLKALIDSLKSRGINVIDSYTIIEKDRVSVKLREAGYNVKSLVNVVMGKECIKDITESNQN